MLSRTMRFARLAPPADSARGAARRRAQIMRLRREQQRESQGTPLQEADGSVSRVQAAVPPRASMASRIGQENDVRAEPSAAFRNAVTQSRAQATDALDVDRTLKQVLLGNEQESPIQHESRMAIRRATSGAAALEAFLLLARTGTDSGGGVTSHALREVASALVLHHVRAQMGPAVYEEALRDAVGSSEDRWQDVTAAEARAFALYHCVRLERHAVKGHAFSAAAGLTLEGSSNDAVALIEYQIQRYTREVAPVSTDVLADLVHLDISWNAALRLYEMARTLRGVDPPVEMSNRLMALMTGYRSNGIGSRPWQQALALYRSVLDSGYDTTLTTHTLALDALWRSGDSFHKLPGQRALCEADRERIWRDVVRVRAEVENAGLSQRIAGDEGCAYYEALIKAVSAAGKTDVALRLLEEMDGQPEDLSYRLLVPTPESYGFAMAACNADGNAAHAEAVRALFQQHYCLRDLHPEVLLVYLQSLRNVARASATIGAQLQSLLEPSATVGEARARQCPAGSIDRPCAVACLQLLAVRAVRLPDGAHRKSELALRLYDCYDATVWLQEPVARKVELQTVFRCCYLIALQETVESGQSVDDTPLMRHVRAKTRSAFGAGSPELEWLGDTEVYGLDTVGDWERALAIFTRQVLQRPPERIQFLPVPLRQAREMCVAALLRSCLTAAADSADGLEAADEAAATADFIFLDDDVQEEERARARELARRCLGIVKDELYPGEPAAAQPCLAIAQLLLIQALCGQVGEERRRLGVLAMRWLGLCDAASLSPRVTTAVSRTLGLTEEYVESVLTDGHPQLRAAALSELTAAKTLKYQGHPIERLYV